MPYPTRDSTRIARIVIHPKHGASLGKRMWAQICADIGKARYAAGRRKTDTCILADKTESLYIATKFNDEAHCYRFGYQS